MEPDQKTWNQSGGPAYEGKCYSDNLNYKYSEVDCNVTPEKKYKLTNVKLIDFWGEGYIHEEDLETTTGFRDAYNINHQYQLVSNGPNIGRKIPNRIPVASYTGYDLKSYINDSAAHYVTLMGSPIDDEAYMEISRILRKEDGVFIYFSHGDLTDKMCMASKFFEEKHFFLLDKNVYSIIDGGENSQHISIPIGFVYMAADKILKYIESKTTSFFYNELANLLYNFYRYDLTEHWKKAIAHLVRNNFDPLLLSTLNALCKDNKRRDCVSQFLNYIKNETNIFFYIQESSRNSEYHYLYTFFEEWEPNMTKVLFGGKYATITNLEFEMPLKLPKKMVDKDKDKPAFGGSAKRGIESDSRNRFYWELRKVSYYGMNFYTLTNVEYGMPLKLPVAMVDKDDDKPAYGGSAERKVEHNQERRFYWNIQAVGDYVL